jgi:hypothetical protein
MSDTLTREAVGPGTEDHGPLRPDLDGLLLSIPGNPKVVWLIMDGGQRRLIPGGPTGPTFSNLFNTGATIIQDINANDIPEQAAITEGAILAVGSSHTVYLITNGVKRPVTAPGMRRYHFNFAKVVSVPEIVLDFIPTGPVIDWRE